MANYAEIITQASDHRALLLENAEHQRLVQSVVAPQPHPFFVWIGRQLIGWGRSLCGEKRMPALSVPPVTVVR
ncbi:MAG: hypothetical protein U0350_28695 [Caldilineaceae bacterium]